MLIAYLDALDTLNAKLLALESENAELRRVVRELHGVAGNLAQVIENRDGDGVLILSAQMKAHGLTK